MPPIANLRGVLPDPSQVKQVVAAPESEPAGPRLARALAAGTLTRDPVRAVYRYHQAFADPQGGRTLVRKTIVCAVRLAPWAEGSVRPHEATVAADRDAALAELRSTKLQAAPVFAGYRDAATEADRLFRKVEGDKPTLEVTTADGTVHRLWRVQSAELFGQLRHLFAPKKLHVLDGHARYEALLAYQAELGAKPLAMYSSANYALMCLVNLDDPTLLVAARHRRITGAPKSDVVLAAAKKHFIVEKLAGAASDLAKHQAALADTLAHQPAFVAVWAGEPDAWKLTLSPDVSPTGEGVQVHRALQKLDPIVVDTMFVERYLPGAHAETTTDAAAALTGDLALITRPLTVEQVRHVTELGQVLPAGSTAFVPALATGLVASVIDPDEDLV